MALNRSVKEISLDFWWNSVRYSSGLLILDFDELYLNQLEQEDLYMDLGSKTARKARKKVGRGVRNGRGKRAKDILDLPTSSLNTNWVKNQIEAELQVFIQWVTIVLNSSDLKIILITDLIKEDIFKLLSQILHFTTADPPNLSIIFESGNGHTVRSNETVEKKEASSISRLKKTQSASKHLSMNRLYTQNSFDEAR